MKIFHCGMSAIALLGLSLVSCASPSLPPLLELETSPHLEKMLEWRDNPSLKCQKGDNPIQSCKLSILLPFEEDVSHVVWELTWENGYRSVIGGYGPKLRFSDGSQLGMTFMGYVSPDAPPLKITEIRSLFTTTYPVYGDDWICFLEDPNKSFVIEELRVFICIYG